MATTTRLTATEFLEWEDNERHLQLIDPETRHLDDPPDLAVALGRGDTLASPQLPGFALDLTALFDEA